MRYPPAETAEKRERILVEGARQFRERGFSGVSVNDVMHAAGLTHGPFYNHFPSKEALMAGCIDHASAKALADLDETGTESADWKGYVEYYLSPEHRENAGQGCLIAALGSEIARQPGVTASLTRHVKSTVEKMAGHFPWGKKRDARAKSIRALSGMVGAMILARAVDDPALSEEILATVRSSLA